MCTFKWNRTQGQKINVFSKGMWLKSNFHEIIKSRPSCETTFYLFDYVMQITEIIPLKMLNSPLIEHILTAKIVWM